MVGSPLARLARLGSRAGRALAVGVLLVGSLGAGGCAAAAWPLLRELARPDRTVVSPAGEDGTRYLAVEGGPLASPASLRSRWGVVARQVCEGEYTKISEFAASRRQGGITRARIHEGYVRCLLPEEREAGAGPTEDEAAAPRRARRRDRGANLAHSRWSR